MGRKFKVLIQQPQGDTGLNWEGEVIGQKKTIIPYNKETVVDESIVEVLAHAVEPYPVVIEEEGQQTRTETRYRSRWMYTAVPVDGGAITPSDDDKPSVVPLVEGETPRRGRPKKVNV